MNISWLTSLIRRTTESARHTVQLLQPSAVDCLFCHKPFPMGSRPSSHHAQHAAINLTQLCPSCQAGIPWIRHIMCKVCGRGIVCSDCTRRKHAYITCNRSSVFYNPTMKNLLALYKYRGNEDLEPLLAAMMLPALRELTQHVQLLGQLRQSRLTDADLSASHSHSIAPRPHSPEQPNKLGRSMNPLLRSPAPSPFHAITYVPVSPYREEERGFNQAERLAARLSTASGVPLMNLLERSRHTEKQSFKSRSERIRDMRGLFKARQIDLEQWLSSPSSQPSEPNLSQLRILLIDDIYTTGSTVNACAEALHQAAGLVKLEVYSLTWAR
ncbi:ComF family protein [Paenibacillus sp. GCM10023252]|uniref:ComF family protein n=1 Tax=Paenibacillus sp. GCM10023252 TaxID=3252649 RepID=UPI00360EEEFE